MTARSRNRENIDELRQDPEVAEQLADRAAFVVVPAIVESSPGKGQYLDGSRTPGDTRIFNWPKDPLSWRFIGRLYAHVLEMREFSRRLYACSFS